LARITRPGPAWRLAKPARARARAARRHRSITAWTARDSCRWPPMLLQRPAPAAAAAPGGEGDAPMNTPHARTQAAATVATVQP